MQNVALHRRSEWLNTKQWRRKSLPFNFFVRENVLIVSGEEAAALFRCVFGCNPRGFLGFSRAGATENKLLAKLIHVPHLGFTQIKMNILWNNNGSIILILNSINNNQILCKSSINS